MDRSSRSSRGSDTLRLEVIWPFAQPKRPLDESSGVPSVLPNCESRAHLNRGIDPLDELDNGSQKVPISRMPMQTGTQ